MVDELHAQEPEQAPDPTPSAPDAPAGTAPSSSGSTAGSGSDSGSGSGVGGKTGTTGKSGASGKARRSRRKPTIVRAKDPLTRDSLAKVLSDDVDNTDGTPADNADDSTVKAPAATEADTGSESGAGVGQLQALWDTGVVESAQFAAKLREIAAYWPKDHDPDLDLRDEAEYLIAQALRTTINHASRLLADAHKATTGLPRLLGLLEEGVLPARWFTFVLRRSSDLSTTKLAELDESIAAWDLRVDEDRFRRRLCALVQWLRDQQETPAVPQRSVEIYPPEDDGTACLQVHGPAPEILSLGRRLDSAARATQQAQRHAIAAGTDIPFDDGTAADTGHALSLARLRYEILTRSILDTGTIPVPQERFRLNITVPALTLLGIEDAPGLLDGIHPIPPQMARELAGADRTWYRVLTDPTTGAFLPLPADRYTPTRQMLEYLRLVFPVCAVPGCTRPTSWASQMDHIEEYNHTHPENGGHTKITNLHPLCWRHHQMKTARLLDPTKQSITHPTPNKHIQTTPHKISPGEPPPETPPETPPPEPTTTAPAFTEEAPGGDSLPGTSSEPKPGIRFNPGVTSWTLRGGPPRHAIDECDLITPWLVHAFTTTWNQYQQRLTAQHSEPDPPPDTEPPPF